MPELTTIDEILDFAIQNEQDAVDLYTDLDDARRDLVLSEAQDKVTLDRKKREITSLEEDVAAQQAERDRIAKLVAINASRKSDLDDAEEKLRDLKEQLEEKKLQYEEDERIQVLQRESRQATIQKLETKIKRTEARIADTRISAPMAGDILEVGNALGVPGSTIKTGDSLFTIADPLSAVIELEVDEQVSGYLQIGQKVDLTVGGTKLTGSIQSIGKVAQVSSSFIPQYMKKRVPASGAGPYSPACRFSENSILPACGSPPEETIVSAK